MHATSRLRTLFSLLGGVVRSVSGRLTSLRAGAALAVLAACCAGPMVAAQPSLPPTDETRYSSAQSGAIGEYVNWLTEQLSTGEVDAVEDARREAARVLDPQDISVAFRSEFAEAALGEGGELADLASSEEDHRAVNALLVVGMLADRRSVPVIEGALGSERQAVRAGAASASRLLITRSAANPAVGQRALDAMLRALASRLEMESSPSVATGVLGAMLSTSGATETFDDALGLAAQALVRRSRDLREEGAGVLLDNGGVAARPTSGWAAVYSQLLGAANSRLLQAGVGEQLDRQMLADVAFNAGFVLRMVEASVNELQSRAEEGEAEPEAGQAFGRSYLPVAAAAEQVLLSVHSRLLNEPLGGGRVRPALERFATRGESLSDFSRALRDWVGEGGRLTDPPYSFEPSSFQLR